MLDNLKEAALCYKKNGYYRIRENILPAEILARASNRVEPILSGTYDSGLSPWRKWNVGDSEKIQKIDQVHLTDNSIFELVTHAVIGKVAAQITGARFIQLWATQLFYKPPGGGKNGAVGWHRDNLYWPFLEGELFTIWIALSEITPESGGLEFIPGSHRWPATSLANRFSDAYRQDFKVQLEQILLASDRANELNFEVSKESMSMGGLSIHDSMVFHGSYENKATYPRKSIALHFRTDKSKPVTSEPDYGYCSYMDNPRVCPIIYSNL